jgi:hypothetical protein
MPCLCVSTHRLLAMPGSAVVQPSISKLPLNWEDKKKLGGLAWATRRVFWKRPQSTDAASLCGC